MKTLRKGKEYTRVAPLPNGWHGAAEVAKAANTDNKYQSSFRKLKSLLDSGWTYCPKSELRGAELKEVEVKTKTKRDKKK
tara:strand:- start:796 stop:1035 length:240 start_codon:yes stop_codon:yes gene_type:complete